MTAVSSQRGRRGTLAGGESTQAIVAMMVPSVPSVPDRVGEERHTHVIGAGISAADGPRGTEMTSSRLVSVGLWAVAVLAGCASPPDPIAARVGRLEEAVAAAERRSADAARVGTAAEASAAREVAWRTDTDRRLGDSESRLLELEARTSAASARGELRAVHNAKWDWLLERDREWVQVGDLVLELEVARASFLVMTANCHAECTPWSERGPAEPDPDKWITISFFVDGRNAPRRAGLPVFHEPELSWGQVHTHPHRNWQALPTTQLAEVEAGKVVVTLRAMQNHGAGRWQLNGAAMYVVAIPRG